MLDSIAERIKGFDAYRLFSETPELPITVDIYGDNAVVHVFRALGEKERRDVEQSLKEKLHVKGFFYKDRTRPAGIALGAGAKKEIIIHEYSHKFLVNLSDYLDTGLFLDHRETRKWIGERSRGKVVLNTFAYTGSFSIYAAAGGAKKTYSVDVSRTYCEWIKKNLELNNLLPETNWVYKMDTFEFFKYARRKKLKFDIIIIDPPTFSRAKGALFSLQKDHPRLIEEALELLAPDGFILFSNNALDFRFDKRKMPRCRIEVMKNTIPPDFEGTFPHQAWLISYQ